MTHWVLRPSRSLIRPGAIGVRAVLFVLVSGLWVGGCTPVGTPAADPGPAPNPIPSIEEGSLPPQAQREAQRLLEEARMRLDAGDLPAAREAARQVSRQYPSARGSGEALAILARSALGLGDPEAAVRAAEAYVTLLGPSHPSYSDGLLLVSRSLEGSGDPEAALLALLQLPSQLPSSVLEAAKELLREDLLERVGAAELREAARNLPPTHPLGGILATEVSVYLYLTGEEEEAELWAERALAAGLEPREEELARGVLGGTLEEVLGRPMILGAVVPRSGVSPGLLEYTEGVLEGVQVAVEEYQGELRRPIRLEVLDHQGDPQGSRESIRRLEELGAFGAVGPLTAIPLTEAAGAREREMPLISPFASIDPENQPGVFSLSGPDPSGSRVVARYAWDLGLERVAVLRPATEEARIQGEAFGESFQALGGVVPREIVYDSGATFFQAELEEVSALLPDGLFLPLAPADVELLAPQVTYYGLDTLGIQLLGTTGWTEDEVVLEVDSRHTDGVVASTTRPSQDETEAYRRFRERYENRFQKSLRTSAPAYGYDAAVLLLQALRTNPRTSRELLEAMEEIQDFPGATGRLSVEGGRILREPQLVRIQNHELIYISSRFR